MIEIYPCNQTFDEIYISQKSWTLLTITHQSIVEHFSPFLNTGVIIACFRAVGEYKLFYVIVKTRKEKVTISEFSLMILEGTSDS